jgi:DnaJ-class molecular chaperone
MACRGTGQVVSNLGGSPHSVTCPWCDGRGLRISGIDAQARWLAERDAGDAGRSQVPPGSDDGGRQRQGEAAGADVAQAPAEEPEPPAAA